MPDPPRPRPRRAPGTGFAPNPSMGPPHDIGPTPEPATRPPLSYVLAAITPDEVQRVARWLWSAPIGEQIEIVLAAPAPIFGRTPARVIPPRVRLASCTRGADRIAVRRAGAAATTGLLVIVIDCDGDFATRLRDPLDQDPSRDLTPTPELARWADELDRVPI